MNLQKHKPYRNRKMLDDAANQSCIRCSKEGETRAAHYNGAGQLMYGKGRGQKCSDFMTAEFCHSCDQQFSEGHMPDWYYSIGCPPEYLEDIRAAEFLHWIAMTNIRRIENGWLG